jgi:hypothetical protein
MADDKSKEDSALVVQSTRLARRQYAYRLSSRGSAWPTRPNRSSTRSGSKAKLLKETSMHDEGQLPIDRVRLRIFTLADVLHQSGT